MADLEILSLFILTYLFGEITSTWVGEHFPSESLKVYSNLSSRDLMYYCILAFSFGPIAEEFLFRGILYQYVKDACGRWFAFVLSTFLFAILHGTTEHLSVTIGVSFLCCIVLEMTGRMRDSIILHICFNICAMIFAMQVPISANIGALVYCVVVIILVIVYVNVGKLRNVCRKCESGVTLEELLNEKKNHWSEK